MFCVSVHLLHIPIILHDPLATKMSSQLRFGIIRNRNEILHGASTRDIYNKQIYLPIFQSFLDDFTMKLTVREDTSRLIPKVFPQFIGYLNDTDTDTLLNFYFYLISDKTLISFKDSFKSEIESLKIFLKIIKLKLLTMP